MSAGARDDRGHRFASVQTVPIGGASVSRFDPLPLDAAGKFNGNDAENSYGLPASFYVEPEIFERERQSIFHRAWRFVAHQSQIPNPGDYVTANIVGQSIFVVRDRNGDIRGFYNVCQHRAHELVRGAGSLKSGIVCPYHAWTYALDGALKGARNFENVAGFKKSDFPLKPVRVEIFCGLVFANLGPDAVPLARQFGDLEPELRATWPDIEALGLIERMDFKIAANWKAVTDNFLENYHVELSGPAHKAFSRLVDMDSFRIAMNERWIGFFADPGDPENKAYRIDPEARVDGRDKLIVFHLWPDLGLLHLPGARALITFHIQPAGPESTNQELNYYAAEKALDETTRRAIAFMNDVIGPEDASLVESVQRGMRSYGYAQGRLMVDRQRNDISEHTLHQFHANVVAALTSPDAVPTR